MATTQMAVGWSKHPDLRTAAREAATRAQVGLGGTPDAALLLSAGGEHPALPLLVREEFGKIPLAGCHAMGLITPRGLSVNGVGILAIRSEEFAVQTVASSESGEDRWLVSARAARLLLAGRPNRRRFPRGLGLIFGDRTVAEHWGPTVKGWREFMGSRLKTVGAVTFGPVYNASTTQTRALAVLLMEGSVPIGVGVGLGFHPLEHTYTVTKHDGCRIVELNGQPAASVYLSALPHDSSELDPHDLSLLIARHPLGLSGGEEHWLIRNVARVERGGLLMTTELSAGSVVRVMAGDPGRLSQAAGEAAATALKKLDGRPPLAGLMIMSASRYDLMQTLSVEESKIIHELIGANIPMIGCLSEAEIGPISGTLPALHMSSVIVVLFGEKGEE